MFDSNGFHGASMTNSMLDKTEGMQSWNKKSDFDDFASPKGMFDNNAFSNQGSPSMLGKNNGPTDGQGVAKQTSSEKTHSSGDSFSENNLFGKAAASSGPENNLFGKTAASSGQHDPFKNSMLDKTAAFGSDAMDTSFFSEKTDKK